MKTLTRVFRSAFLAIAMAATALAQSDTTPPTVQSLTFTPNAGDITSGAVTVTVTARITDALSGVDYMTGGFHSPSGVQNTSFSLSVSNRISGTAQEGVYQTTTQIPRFSEAGVWRLNGMVMADFVGNSVYLYPPGPNPPNIPSEFDRPLVISGTSDVAPPTVESLTFTPSSGDMTNGPVTVTVTARITDALSEVYYMNGGFRSPSGAQAVGFSFTSSDRVSGTAQDGIYRTTTQIPRFAEGGVWRLSGLTMGDLVGNNRYLSPPGLNAPNIPLEFDLPLAITGTSDVSVPILQSLTFTPSIGDVRPGPIIVTVTARITDALSGVYYMNGGFRSPSGKQPMGFSFTASDRISGTAQDGIYRTTTQIPRFAEAGVWRLSGITMGDLVGNSRYLSPPGLNAPNIPSEFDLPLQVTSDVPPDVAAAATTAISANSATVNGAVTPRSLATTWWVEYGPTVVLGHSTTPANAGDGTARVPVSHTFSGMTPLTTVFFRFAAQNGNGFNRSAIESFTTLADTTTDPPVLYYPYPEANSGERARLQVSFALPEAALPGSVKLSFGSTVITLAASHETRGFHYILLNPAAPLDSPEVASGSPFMEGTYTVRLEYRNALGNPAASVELENVTIDTTAPVIHEDFGNPLLFAGTAFPDFTIGADVTDNIGVLSVWQSPAPGAQVIATQKTVTITASDAMGNTSSVSFQVRIAPSPAVARVTTGGAVPNAGVGDAPRIPAGAVWSGFGSPVISEGGYFAFLGKWKSPSGKGVGIFSSNDTEGTPRLEVKVGDSVNGVAGAVWKTLGDPVYFYPSGVAWIGTISGPGITSVNDTAVGSAAVSFYTVLREGESPQPLGGARINGVRNIAAVGPFGTLLLDVTLEVGTGTPATTSATDRAALMWLPESGVILLFRECQNIGEGSETLKNYLFLDSIPGSPGHGRATRSFGTTALWTLSSGRKSAMQDGNIFAETGGDVDNYSPGARWAKVGIPSRNDLGDVSAMRGTLKVGPGGVTAANASGIFFNDDTYWYNVARMNGPSPGIAGATFATFLDPVVGGHFVNRHGAVIAKVRGSSVTSADNTGIWHGGRADWTLLAREGAQPPSAPAGAKWKAFTSLAMPQDAGPIFTATLQRGPGGITSADDTALYGLGSDDILYELLREGQTLLGGKVVQSFNVLTATLGSQGTTRHFNSAGGIVARVEFTDHTSAIVRLSVP